MSDNTLAAIGLGGFFAVVAFMLFIMWSAFKEDR